MPQIAFIVREEQTETMRVGMRADTYRGTFAVLYRMKKHWKYWGAFISGRYLHNKDGVLVPM